MLGIDLYAGMPLSRLFLLFVFMNLRGYSMRDELELDELERCLARVEIRGHLITVAIGVVSILLALFSGRGGAAWSGLVYFAMGPVHGVHGWRSAVFAERIQERLAEEG